MTLDPKGLTAAATAMRAECPCIPVMDISEPFLEMMLDKAIRAYLSAVPSDVAGLVERSKGEWRYDIQYGPEGEANYAWVYSGKGMVATCKTHHAIAIVNAMNDAMALSALSARPSVNETMERAARLAKSAWLEANIGTIADADAQSELCEWIAAAIRQMKEPDRSSQEDEPWREIKQHVQPQIADGYTAVKISAPGFWLVKGPGPATAFDLEPTHD